MQCFFIIRYIRLAIFGLQVRSGPHLCRVYPMGNQLLNRPVAVGSDVREPRLAAAERFELSLRIWQMKEAAKNPVS